MKEAELKELRLLNYKNKSLLRTVFSRTGLVVILLAVEVFLLFFAVDKLLSILPYALTFVIVFDFVIAVLLAKSDMDSSAKLAWILFVISLPGIGGIFYVFAMLSLRKTELENDIKHSSDSDKTKINRYKNLVKQNGNVKEHLKKDSPEIATIAECINRNGCYPVYKGSKVTYYSFGEYKWKAILDSIEKAKKFIFIEFFIIEEGTMWGSILNLLAEKAKQGVEVRVMYDGTCEFRMLSADYPKRLENLGIKCRVFSPLSPVLSVGFNFRDHRKIIVVDGKSAFTGGINLADEYINKGYTKGHWKDTAVKVEGDCVKNFTLMFLNMWHIGEKGADFRKYIDIDFAEKFDCRGYVIPFGYTPFERYKIGEKVYMDILQRSVKYVHIMTPFLVLGDEFMNTLKFTAERGVDVKIIMSGIPDNKPMQALSTTYYKTLMESGVKIYLYTLGVVHAKVFVSDDIKAVVGSINLDYRSLYHNFECGVYLYENECIADIERDFSATLNKSVPVTEESLKKEKLIKKVSGAVMRLVAPMM